MSAPDELLPCPFCGGKPAHYDFPEYADQKHMMECDQCDSSTGFYVSEEEARKGWNRRYIRASESAASNALPAGLLALLEHGIDDRIGFQSACWVHRDVILAALRNQPGGAVPRVPTEEMLLAVDRLNVPVAPPEYLTDAYCERWRQQFRNGAIEHWRVMWDAATKAGEGET